MAKMTGFYAAAAMMVALSGPVFAEGETAATVIATVNGTEITLGQMIALRENLPPQYLDLPDDVLYNGLLEQLVQQEVLAQAHTELSARDTANVDNSRRAYLSGVVIEDVVTSSVTDEALQAAYDARFKDAAPQQEYNAAHILVDDEEKAKELKSQIEGGADFAELAKANSTDTGSGAQGGDLGWFGLGMMVKPFEDAVVAATPGKVTDPVKSDFGWHIVLVKETRTAAQPTLDEMREELAVEIENKAVEAKITALTDAAKIERPGAAFDPAVAKKTELID
ncbi:peptidylprolyl isomerase [Xinfangfangia sp. CPCC 101601]|uniref:Parvulin-like PPIase n=1 Tax=Pseudogemmobacter lacusdianii TaxID=3069608 RepID=A0ABU0VU83_9RHOB|nr:peptidylprolyl isomerase [Xinfangfangia sp. CPCC 101601]MDQ2065113.1 peptidylprolyl isomerase [Xinfangfangia sp. CPCC 101601]